MNRHRPLISARGATRLLEGEQAAGPHERQVAQVLSALSPGEEQRSAPDVLLAAFAEGAGRGRDVKADRGRRRSGARARRVGTAAAVKAGALVLVLSGGTIAAAEADVLPTPAQRIAHSLFGSWGLPAPHTPPPASTAPKPTSSSGASPGPGTSASAEAQSITGASATASPSSTCSARNRGQDDPCKTTPAQARTQATAVAKGDPHSPNPHKKSTP